MTTSLAVVQFGLLLISLVATLRLLKVATSSSSLAFYEEKSRIISIQISPKNNVISNRSQAIVPQNTSDMENVTFSDDESNATLYQIWNTTMEVLPTSRLDTSIVITSSLIPSHPSIQMINHTIQSIHHRLIGLDPNSPLIFVVDGPRLKASEKDRQKLELYVENLRNHYPHATVLAALVKRGLTRNVIYALQYVQTKYLYLIQHDLMFIFDIDHNAIVKTMEDYPDLLRIVRFNQYRNVRRHGDQRHKCFGEQSILNNINGIHFTKTGHWSDNNQFASKRYYQEIFGKYFPRDELQRRPMEHRMQPVARVNCSYEGPWLYGRLRQGPFLLHLDGRKTNSYEGAKVIQQSSGK